MKMKLNVMERMVVLQVLPAESNFVTLKIVRDLQQNLIGFSEAELKDFEIKQLEDGRVSWNVKGAEPKEIKIGEKATEIIVEAFKELDKQNKLTPTHLDAYEKFVTD